MATSKYFNHLDFEPEQKFFEDILIENIKITGVDAYYMPREMFEIDPVLQEPVASSFNSSRAIEIYVDQTEGYEGQGDILTKLGVITEGMLTVRMSKKRFREEKIPDRDRPREGDLIYIGLPDKNRGRGTYINSFYEITFVKTESPFWQLGQYAIYKLTLQQFTYGYEKFNTGHPTLDQLQPVPYNTTELSMAQNTQLNQKEQEIVDKTEMNPFGDF